MCVRCTCFLEYRHRTRSLLAIRHGREETQQHSHCIFKSIDIVQEFSYDYTVANSGGAVGQPHVRFSIIEYVRSIARDD